MECKVRSINQRREMLNSYCWLMFCFTSENPPSSQRVCHQLNSTSTTANDSCHWPGFRLPLMCVQHASRLNGWQVIYCRSFASNLLWIYPSLVLLLCCVERAKLANRLLLCLFRRRRKHHHHHHRRSVVMRQVHNGNFAANLHWQLFSARPTSAKEYFDCCSQQ